MKLIKWSIMVAVFFCWVGSVHALVYHVSPTGNDNPPWPCGNEYNPCRTIGHVVSFAVNGDTIKVAEGFYWENVRIDTSISDLTIQGGWNGDFSARTEDPSVTVVFNKDTVNTNAVFSFNAGVWESISVTLEGLTIRGTLDMHRIGVYISSVGGQLDVSLLKNRIVNNTESGVSVYSGGGEEVSVVLHENQIMWNQEPEGVPPSSGGGIYAACFNSLSTITLNLEKNVIAHNTANSGGGIYLFCSKGAMLQAEMENNVIMNNKAINDHGGGIATSTGDTNSQLTVNLINNTISQNTAGSSGGGIYVDSFFGATNLVSIFNTIIWGNSANSSENDIHIHAGTSTVNASYSDIGDVSISGGGIYNPGPGNLNADPSFDTDFHLLSRSPAIDKGQCGVKILNIYIRRAPYDDIDGDLRPGFGKFWGCDIGADEYIVKAMPYIPFLLFDN